jgi:hypothetical protein
MQESSTHRSIIGLVFLFSLLLVTRMGFPSQKTAQPELTLLVYTYADYSPYQTRLVQERVAFIYGYAGIQINWLDCTRRTESDQLPAACGHSPGASDLVIRLEDRSALPIAGNPIAQVGHSYATQEGGTYGSVSCPAIRRLAKGDRTSEVEILGHAIAHEIGHLLLGAQAHTGAGIMKPRWNEKDLLEMVRCNGLLFSERQAESLRLRLTARQRTAFSDQASLRNGE